MASSHDDDDDDSDGGGADGVTWEIALFLIFFARRGTVSSQVVNDFLSQLLKGPVGNP